MGDIPPGPAAGFAPGASPYDVPTGPAGPPPGYARPAPSEPIGVAPVSAKKPDDDDEWDISHLAPDYTWKKFKEAIGWGPDEKLAKAAYDKGQALVPREEVRGGGRGVLHGLLALARLDDGRRRPVPHGRVVLLLRPIRQGAGLLRQPPEAAQQHALSGHGGRPAVRHWHLLGTD